MVLAILVFLLGVAGTALTRLLAEDFKAWIPWMVKNIIRRAIERLPEQQRSRFDEEWQSHINDVPGEIGKLFVAVGFLSASRKMVRLLKADLSSSLHSLEQQILQLKTYQAELQQSAQEYRAIIEDSPSGFCRLDQDGRILMANRAVIDMLGYETEEDLQRLNLIRDIYFMPGQPRKVLLDFQPTFSSARAELFWRTKNGGKILVRLNSRKVPSQPDTKVFYEIFVENITEQRSLERQFQHAQKMEAIGKLAGGVAHDFNNLLMIIGASADFAGENKHNPEKISRYVRQIQQATAIATSVTRQLLMFSRKQVLERCVQDLNCIVSDLTKMLPRLLGEDVKLIIRLGAELRTANVDRGHIEQVVMNLAVNARDAMPIGGNLLIETANVIVEEDSIQPPGLKLVPGNYVALSAQDSGIGMNEEIKSRIFEPFFTTKERGKGTGLGLSTVYGLVEQNGGKISVESEPGKGSAFTVYFPAADGPVLVPIRARRAKRLGDGSQIVLYAEDDAALREIAQEFLEDNGFKVLSAANGNEALNFCKNHKERIDVLVTDLVMPGMPGTELAERALQLRPELRVIYVSGYTEHLMDLQNLSPHSLFLQKPFDMADLTHHIRSFWAN